MTITWTDTGLHVMHDGSEGERDCLRQVAAAIGRLQGVQVSFRVEPPPVVGVDFGNDKAVVAVDQMA